MDHENHHKFHSISSAAKSHTTAAVPCKNSSASQSARPLYPIVQRRQPVVFCALAAHIHTQNFVQRQCCERPSPKQFDFFAFSADGL